MTSSIPAPDRRGLIRRADLRLRESPRVARLFREGLSAEQRAVLGRLVAEALDRRMRVHLVGGVVRDLLLRRPVRDLDVAVEGDAGLLARGLGGALEIHEAFGTASVRLPGGLQIDLARTREERYRQPAALPEVRAAGLDHDLARRDFTVNALALPLARDGPTGLIDPFGGWADLRARRLRLLHRGSLRDDPTRALRAVRLAVDLGFRIEPASERAIRRAVASGVFRLLSPRRLGREVERTLSPCRGRAALRLLSRYGLLAAVDSAWRAPASSGRLLQRLDHERRRFPTGPSPSPPATWPVVLALLLRDAERATRERVLDRLGAGRRIRAAVAQVLEGRRRLPRQLSTPRRVRASAIHAACSAYGAETLLAVLVATRSASVRRAILRYVRKLRAVRLDIDGADLLRDGLAPGPALGAALRAALAAKLDGRAPGREQQLRVARASASRS